MMRRVSIVAVVLLVVTSGLHAHNGEWVPPKPTIPFPKAPKRPIPEEWPGGVGAPPGERVTSPDLKGRTGWSRWWFLHRERLIGGGAKGEVPGREAALAALRPLVNHENEDLRTSAIIALGRARDLRIVPRLLDLLGKDDISSPVAESAVLALGLIGAKESRKALGAVLADDEWHGEIRVFAAVALGLSGEAAAAPALLSRLHPKEKDKTVRRGAIVGIGLLGLDIAVPDLAKALEGPDDRDPDAMSRAYAAAALGALGGGHARNALHRSLRDYDPSIGRQSALALGSIGTAKAESALRWAFANQKDALLRAYAALSLAEAGDALVYAGLKDAYRKGDSLVAAHAAVALGLLAGRTKDAAVRPKVHVLFASQISDVTGPDLFGALAIGAGLAKAKNVEGKIRSRFVGGKDPEARGHAAVALALLGGSADTIRPVLTAKTPPPLFREAAVALAILEDRQAEARLRRILAGKSPETIRTLAAVSLGLSRAPEEPTVTALTKAVANEKLPVAVRSGAVVGLGRLLEKESPSRLALATLRLGPAAATGPLREILSMR